MSIQKRNSELVDLLTPDFQKRYEPNFALGNVISLFSSIPGLRGFWPMSSFDSNAAAIDLTGLHNLANVGQAQYGWSELRPYCYFDGTTSDYLWVADNADHDILGTETFVLSTKRGLTLGGWYNFSALAPANAKGIIGKWNATAADRSYLIYIDAATSVARFVVSSGGGAVTAAVSSTYTLSTNTWYFITARYDPSNLVIIDVNGTSNEDTSAVGVPAALFNSAADFNIFALNNGAANNRNYGYASFNFLSTMLLSDAIINNLFNQSKALFGVH